MRKIKLLDIGAANFKIEDRWLIFRDEIEFILFEPDQRSYIDLANKGYKVFNYALGCSEEEKVFNLTRKPACSSFLKPNMDYLSKFPNKERWEILNTICIRTTELDSFSLDIDFIKIDTQGTELDILKGAEKTLSKVIGLELEVSFLEIYKNQPLFGEVCEYLNKKGFEFYDFIVEYRYGRKELNRKGQLAFADALFLRTPENIIETNKDKIATYEKIVKVYRKDDLL